MCYVLCEKNNKKYLFLFGVTKIKHYIYITKHILKVMIVINKTIAAAITDSIDGNHGSFSIEVGNCQLFINDKPFKTIRVENKVVRTNRIQ